MHYVVNCLKYSKNLVKNDVVCKKKGNIFIHFCYCGVYNVVQCGNMY